LGSEGRRRRRRSWQSYNRRAGWGSKQTGQRAGLLGRLANRESTLIRELLAAAAGREGSWVRRAAEDFMPWSGGTLPASSKEWNSRIKRWKRDWTDAEAERIEEEIREHKNLASYQLWGRAEGERVNGQLYNNDMDERVSRDLGRLLVGGQGLQAGDPQSEPRQTRDNVCLACLREGRVETETLRHVILRCGAYAEAREEPQVAQMIDEAGIEVLRLRRDRWGWAQLKAIVRYLTDIVAIRRREQHCRGRRAREKQKQERQELWERHMG